MLFSGSAFTKVNLPHILKLISILSPQSHLINHTQHLLTHSSISNLKPHEVDPIIFGLRAKPTLAIRFFQWCDHHLGFHYQKIESFCSLVCLLLKKRLFDHARKVFDEMTERFGDFDTFDAFCFGVRSYCMNGTTVYSFLIDSYCRIGEVEKAFEVFFRTSGNGISISPYALTRLSNCLVDLKRVDVIIDVYSEISNDSKQNKDLCSNLYGYVMGGFFKKSEASFGFEFHKAIVEKGLMPNVVTCNKIMKGFCNDKCLTIAHEFLSLIIEVGPIPTVVTFSTLIKAYCKESKLEEAFQLYDLMLLTGIIPDLVVYSILVDGLFRAGKMEEGNQVILVALDKGIVLDVGGSYLDDRCICKTRKSIKRF